MNIQIDLKQHYKNNKILRLKVIIYNKKDIIHHFVRIIKIIITFNCHPYKLNNNHNLFLIKIRININNLEKIVFKKKKFKVVSRLLINKQMIIEN